MCGRGGQEGVYGTKASLRFPTKGRDGELERCQGFCQFRCQPENLFVAGGLKPIFQAVLIPTIFISSNINCHTGASLCGRGGREGDRECPGIPVGISQAQPWHTAMADPWLILSLPRCLRRDYSLGLRFLAAWQRPGSCHRESSLRSGVPRALPSIILTAVLDLQQETGLIQLVKRQMGSPCPF